MSHRVILLQAAAPPKPAPGEPCNGCGVCCTWAPCPIGLLLTRRAGPCRALVWDAPQGLYRCGVLTRPQDWLPAALPAHWARRLARRWIAAGAGCDSLLEVEPGAPGAPG